MRYLKGDNAVSITNEYVQLDILDSFQNGYDAIEAVIWKYFDHNPMDDLIVRIGISYDGNDYDVENELVLVENGSIEFLNDWWEGQKYIRVYGIQSIPNLDISGGLYPD